MYGIPQHIDGFIVTKIQIGQADEKPIDHYFTLRIDPHNPLGLGESYLDPTAVALLYALAMDAKEKNLDEKQAVYPLLMHAVEQAELTPRVDVNANSHFCKIVQLIQEELALIDKGWKNREGTIKHCRKPAV